MTCKLRVKMHVGRLGVKWAARLVEPRGKPMQGPKEALEHIFGPSKNVPQRIGSGEHFWQFTRVKHDSCVKFDI